MTFKISRTSFSITASLIVPTEDEAKAIAAQFPKSVGVKGTTLTSPRDGSYLNGSVLRGFVRAQFRVDRADGSTGGTNETAQRRWASFQKNAAKLGYAVAD